MHSSPSATARRCSSSATKAKERRGGASSKPPSEAVADLFSKPLVVTTEHAEEAADPLAGLPPYYRDFAKDADLRETSLCQLLRQRTASAMVHRVALLGVDFPKVEEAPSTLLEEERSGADRAYAFPIELASLIDWRVDDFGRWRWLVLRSESCERESVESSRDVKTIAFKHWEKDQQTGQVRYAVHRFRCKPEREPKPEELSEVVDEGVVSFPEVPVIALKLPEELHVGGLIGHAVANIFKRRTALEHAENRSLYELLVYKQGAELPANGALSEKGSDPNRGEAAARSAKARGAVVIGPEDEVSFVGPSGVAFDLVHQQLKDSVDEVHRVTHTMAQSVSNTSTAVGRSGASKMQDNKAKEIVLSAYADAVKDFALRLYSLVSKARGEALEWQTLGMDSYRVVDREQTLAEAQQLAAINIPSKTFKKHQALRLVIGSLP